MIRLAPASIVFEPQEVGTWSDRVTVSVENTGPERLGITVRGSAIGDASEFPVKPPAEETLEPSEETHIEAMFCPRNIGPRREVLSVEASAPSGSRSFELRLAGTGIAPRSFSFREVSLPRRQAGKEGPHYMLSISNPRYLEALARYSKRPHGYVALPSGTQRGKVTAGTSPRAGQILIDPRDTFLEKHALLYCFDLQTISTRWLTRQHTVLHRQALRRRIQDAAEHAFQDPGLGPTCSDCLDPTRLKRFMASAPSRGSILRDRGGVLVVVVSPPVVTAYYASCFSEPMALVVLAEPAGADDSTTYYGIRTTVKLTLGSEVFVMCHALDLWPLDRTVATGASLTATELTGVTDRLRASLDFR